MTEIEILSNECERLRKIINDQNQVIDQQYTTILHLDDLIRNYESMEKVKKL